MSATLMMDSQKNGSPRGCVGVDTWRQSAHKVAVKTMRASCLSDRAVAVMKDRSPNSEMAVLENAKSKPGRRLPPIWIQITTIIFLSIVSIA